MSEGAIVAMHTHQRNMEDIRVPIKKLEKDDKNWALAFKSIHLLAKKGMKKETVDEQRELLKKLRKYENFLEPAEEKKYPHTFALIEAARTLAEKTSGFYKKYWNPFIKAYAELLQDIERNPVWQTVLEKDGLPCVQAGRGNRILPYPGVKKGSFQKALSETLAQQGLDDLD